MQPLRQIRVIVREEQGVALAERHDGGIDRVDSESKAAGAVREFLLHVVHVAIA